VSGSLAWKAKVQGSLILKDKYLEKIHFGKCDDSQMFK